MCRSGDGREEQHPVCVVPQPADDGDSECSGWEDSGDSADRWGNGWRGVQSGDDGGVQLAGRWDADDREGEEPDEFCGGTDADNDAAGEDADARYEDE